MDRGCRIADRLKSRPLEFQLKGEVPRPSGGQRRSQNRNYRPGDTVRQSGIYEVVHDRAHRDSHEVVMISGDRFPPCETCRDRVRFRMVRSATYIFFDQDFETSAD